MSLEKALQKIKNGVEEIITEQDLIDKLKRSEKTGIALRIKYGIDPTNPDVHLGHLVPIRKMRDFQDLGHTGVIIIGDFTAQIGDPTGRDEMRPHLCAEHVKKNAETFMDQLYTVLDKHRTEVRWQTEWFGNMGMAEVIELMSKFTLAQFMAHETFRKRYEQGKPLFMHEIMYPILQAYDSVVVKADVELGATEQKFNILAGRDMQRYFNMSQQVVILSPILIGTDGVEKMSKSLNNYIAVNDSPKDKYGKVMSIPDSIIINYFKYATNVGTKEIKEIERQLKEQKVNPKVIKQRLAREIVKLYHGEKSAEEAEREFERVFSQSQIPSDIPEYTINKGSEWIVRLLTETNLVTSGGEARRMIKQGAVSIDGKKVNSADIDIEIRNGMVIKVGKRRFCRIVKNISVRRLTDLKIFNTM